MYIEHDAAQRHIRCNHLPPASLLFVVARFDLIVKKYERRNYAAYIKRLYAFLAYDV